MGKKYFRISLLLALPLLVGWFALRPRKPQPLSSAAQHLIKKAFEGLDPSMPLVDVHAHLVGLGTNGSGAWLNPEKLTWRHPLKRIQTELYIRASGVKSLATFDQDYIEKLMERSRAFVHPLRIHLLAFDHAYTADGQIDEKHSEFFTPNEAVMAVARRHPDRIVPVISVHPARKDALAELDRWADQGVRYVKWLPNAQRIDPADPRWDPFYQRMVARGMVLLTHVGEEKAVHAPEEPVPKPPRAALGAPGGVPQGRRDEHSGSTRFEPDAVEGRPPPQPGGTTPGGRSAASAPLNDEPHRPAGPSFSVSPEAIRETKGNMRSIPPGLVAARGGFGTGSKAQALGNPLRFRHALDLGLTVIMAHCASLGRNEDLDHPGQTASNFDLFLRLMAEPRYEGRLWGDISAITQFNRLPEPLLVILRRPDLQARLLNGSDYPLPGVNLVIWLRKLVKAGLLTQGERLALIEVYEDNPLRFDFVLKRTLRNKEGQYLAPAIFTARASLPAGLIRGLETTFAEVAEGRR